MTTDRNSGIPKVQATAPERINLTIADEEFYRDEPFPAEFGAEICWSSDQPVAVCVPYVRADLCIPVAGLEALVEELRTYAGGLCGGHYEPQSAVHGRICGEVLAYCDRFAQLIQEAK